MKRMKVLFIVLLLPVFSIAQTVHIKEEKIIYEGKEKIEGASSQQILDKIQKQLPGIIDNYKEESLSGNSLKAKGELKLTTPYNVVRSVAYTLTLNPADGGYEYLIDDVFFIERERGKKRVTKTSEEVLEGMTETGKLVGETEKILNETDMLFQKLLALIKSATSKE
jgi:hypothetical protein